MVIITKVGNFVESNFGGQKEENPLKERVSNEAVIVCLGAIQLSF